MAEFPLTFSYTDVVSGRGYMAGIRLEGRSLLVQEPDGWWMLGARPGAIAASGDTEAEAAAAFRNQYRLVLFDIAGEAPSFEAFKAEVEALVQQTDSDLDRWRAALEELRARRVDAEQCGAFIAALPRKRVETDDQARLLVQRLDQRPTDLTPAINQVDVIDLAEAA